jgi:Double zinc ribbon domain
MPSPEPPHRSLGRRHLPAPWAPASTSARRASHEGREGRLRVWLDVWPARVPDWWSAAWAALAPPACWGCRASVAPGHALCPACRRALPFLRGARCPRCALPSPCGERCPAAGSALARAWTPVAFAGPARALVHALKFRAALGVADAMAAQIVAGAPPGLLAAPAARAVALSGARGPADAPARSLPGGPPREGRGEGATAGAAARRRRARRRRPHDRRDARFLRPRPSRRGLRRRVCRCLCAGVENGPDRG